MTQRQTDSRNNEILIDVRRRVLKALAEREIKIDGVYERLAKELKKEFKDATPSQIRKIARRQMTRIVARSIPIIEKQLEDSSLYGDDAAREQFISTFPKDERAGSGVAFKTAHQQMKVAGRRIRGRIRGLRKAVPLSRRLWENHQGLGERMARSIARSIEAQKSMAEIADEFLLKLDPATDTFENLKQRVPKYIDDLADAARRAAEAGEQNIFDEAIRRHRAQLEGQAPAGTYTVRAATEQAIADFRKAIDRGLPDMIDQHVDRWVVDRARTHARFVARNETLEAYREAYILNTKDQPYVKGFRWSLSPKHPEADVCDIFAHQDLHGLGPGGYPVDAVPPTPHPIDLCTQVAIIDGQHFEREIAKVKGEREPPKAWLSGRKQTGAEWLKTKSRAFRDQVLGKKNAELFEHYPDKVLAPGGKVRRVKDVLKSIAGG